MKKYPILQSGFIALTETGLQLPKFHDATMSMAVLGKDAYNNLSEYFFSPAIEELAVQWKNDPFSFKDFAFRERVLVEGYKAFGTTSLRQWLELQAHRPGFSKMHEQFLLDTLQHVIYGREREVEALMWLRLLFPGTGHNVSFDLSNQGTVGEHLSLDGLDNRHGPLLNTLPFLQRWVAQPDGYADLLKTLYVIFGQRRAVSDTVIT